jgi:hypothetical protein
VLADGVVARAQVHDCDSANRFRRRQRKQGII